MLKDCGHEVMTVSTAPIEEALLIRIVFRIFFLFLRWDMLLYGGVSVLTVHCTVLRWLIKSTSLDHPLVCSKLPMLKKDEQMMSEGSEDVT